MPFRTVLVTYLPKVKLIRNPLKILIMDTQILLLKKILKEITAIRKELENPAKSKV